MSGDVNVNLTLPTLGKVFFKKTRGKYSNNNISRKKPFRLKYTFFGFFDAKIYKKNQTFDLT